MKSFAILVYIFSLFTTSTNCFAKQVTLPNTEMKYLTSKSGVDYKLYISLPEGYYDDKENFSYRKNYLVLYVLDGDIDFAMVKNITDTMVNFGTIEPIIVVGIGYKGQELSQYNSKIFWENYMLNRTRDYIPQKLTKDVDRFMKERVDGYQFVENHWQGEKFRYFIENELITNINKNYRTSGENALLGHSLGGLFASFVMLENSSAFNKYMILSPSAINEIGIIEEISKMKKNNVKAYFAVGSLEFYNKGSMVKDLESFYQKMPKEKLESKIEIIDNEDHISVFPIAFTKGIKYLLPTQNNKNNSKN